MPQNRRTFVKNSVLAAAGLAVGSTLLSACTAGPGGKAGTASTLAPGADGSFTLPDLPYAFDALAPHIDAETMRIHHGKHHAGYVKKLNAALAEAGQPAPSSLEEVLQNMSAYPIEIQESIRNNGGGHWNHSFFWPAMQAPTDAPVVIPKDLENRLVKDFGSMEAFQAAFTDAAKSRFGSGWAWLVKTPEGKLAVGSTPNQDNPLMPDAELVGTPLLGLDVWEHAYYLNYQNKRGAYIQEFWQLVNWARMATLLG